MSYQRFKKGGWVAKSPFLEKVCENSLIKKMKTDFFQKKKHILLIADNSETVHF